jgi:hypothetical protein
MLRPPPFWDLKMSNRYVLITPQWIWAEIKIGFFRFLRIYAICLPVALIALILFKP